MNKIRSFVISISSLFILIVVLWSFEGFTYDDIFHLFISRSKYLSDQHSRQIKNIEKLKSKNFWYISHLSIQYRLPKPYLLLVTFYSKVSFSKIDSGWLQILDKTPYDGIGVMFDGVVSQEKPVEYCDIEQHIHIIKQNTSKHIWPWIFFNRFVQRPAEKYGSLTEDESQYFSRINGMDIFNKTGALTDFKKIFSVSLRVAKNLGVPGIIIDHELYNNHRLYDIGKLSKALGISERETKRQLNNVGRDLGKIVRDEYPEAILWFLSVMPGRSTTYITQGILDEAKESYIPLTIVEGGENSLGYINKTINQLDLKKRSRQKMFYEWIRHYQPSFQLGGTIAPTNKAESRLSFVKDGYDGTSINSIEDLEPFFINLFESYDYVWIYAAKAAQFNPFNSKDSKDYHKIINKSLIEVRGGNKK